ncbi:MarR family winged helix-turn-helix transcriptional regulator [Actinotalea sp. K2]|uniref:MarR family winged helix-turn-helix transcriptional regulator n=1 Tax=Actinotalea sp. K2 TaxID=2939438 RepID=UPI002016A8D6|nr:MarR family winged helix-turn-helix transcriptional regulator [Actinotalea sp. K2]MCL3859639.1 MarR family winged helix-turn-helix transcriptional regulator [Actinotalea sp. K2]
MSDRITYSLNHLVTAMNAYADQVLAERWGLTFSQFTFLAVLEDGQPLDITRMAECLGVSKAAVSKRVPGLQAKGYVQTVADPANARRVLLTLTDEGLRLAHEAGGLLDAELTQLFEGRADLDLDRTHADVLLMLEAVLSKGNRS